MLLNRRYITAIAWLEKLKKIIKQYIRSKQCQWKVDGMRDEIEKQCLE